MEENLKISEITIWLGCDTLGDMVRYRWEKSVPTLIFHPKLMFLYENAQKTQEKTQKNSEKLRKRCKKVQKGSKRGPKRGPGRGHDPRLVAKRGVFFQVFFKNFKNRGHFFWKYARGIWRCHTSICRVYILRKSRTDRTDGRTGQLRRFTDRNGRFAQLLRLARTLSFWPES